MNGMTKMNVNVVVLKVVLLSLSLSQTHITHTPHTNKKNDVQNPPAPPAEISNLLEGASSFFFSFFVVV